VSRALHDATSIPVLDLAAEVEEVRPALDAAWQRVVASGHFILGPEVEAFESEVASYLGVRHAIGVNSGTDALVLALRALGIGPGDEVITSPFTFFATAESINAVGASPVFVDIDPDTFNLRPDLVERALGTRTRAILPVHLFGHAAEVDVLQALARAKGLSLVEDVAQAFGGALRGKKLGTFGHAAAFSFFRPRTSAVSATEAWSAPTTTRRPTGCGCFVRTVHGGSTSTRPSATTRGSTRCRPRSFAPSSRTSTPGTLLDARLPTAIATCSPAFPASSSPSSVRA
jgi:hypothetical protein